jgi:hypothetical protein
MRKSFLIGAVLGFVLALPACNSATVVAELAAVEYVLAAPDSERAERAARVVAAADTVERMVTTGQFGTVAELQTFVLGLIDTADPRRRAYLLAASNAVFADINALLPDGGLLSPEAQAEVVKYAADVRRGANNAILPA